MVPPGATIVVEAPGGGGYGDPGDRDPAAVAAHVREGYVSARVARDTYRQPAD